MKHIIAFSISAAAAFSAVALDVNSTAGKLAEAVGTATDAASLKVSGSVNAADLMFIHSEMGALTSLDLSGATIDEYDGEPLLNSVAYSPAGAIPPAAFLGMKLSSFAFPSNTASIGEGAFAATSLESVAVPAGVASIGNSAFADAPRLASVTLPSTVSHLGFGAFRGCSSLASATLSAPLAEIPAATFSGCSSLRSVAIPASVRVIGEKAFANSGLTSVALNDIDSVAPWAFLGCAELGAVTFSGNLPRVIGQGAFFRDANAEVGAAGLPGTLSEVAPHTFTGVKAVSGLGAAEASSIGEIGEYALAYTSVGESVYLPAELRKVGDSAFANWTGVRSIDATDISELPEIGDDIFGNLDKPNTTLYVAPDMLDTFMAAPQWKEFKIEAKTSGETGIDAPATPETAEVAARFEGTLLRLTSTFEITAVELYDLSGLRLAFIPAVASLDFTIDTAPFSSPAYIVRIHLGPSAVKLLKLAR